FAAQAGGGGTITNYLSRTVQITTRQDPIFNKALVCKQNVNFNGNNCATDSYNSSVAPYLAATAGDKGDIATNSDLVNALSSGNANIKGHLGTGPNATVKIGPNGVVRSVTWSSWA